MASKRWVKIRRGGEIWNKFQCFQALEAPLEVASWSASHELTHPLLSPSFLILHTETCWLKTKPGISRANTRHPVPDLLPGFASFCSRLPNTDIRINIPLNCCFCTDRTHDGLSPPAAGWIRHRRGKILDVQPLFWCQAGLNETGRLQLNQLPAHSFRWVNQWDKSEG